MSYFSTCKVCGAHLDPGEQCTCTMEDTKEKTGGEHPVKGSGEELPEDTKENV